MILYEITLFMPYTADKAGTIVVPTEEMMVQEVKDHIRDGLSVYVCAREQGTNPPKPKGLTDD